MPTDIDMGETPAVFHLQNQLHPQFCEAIQDGNIADCKKILAEIPSEHILSFLQAQTIEQKNIFAWLFQSCPWQDLTLFNTLLQYIPPSEEAAIFLAKQKVFKWKTLLEKSDCITDQIKKENTIIAILEKIPAINIATFLHAQPMGESYARRGFIVWLCEAGYSKALKKLLTSLPPEDLMPVLNSEFGVDIRFAYSIFEWLMHRKDYSELTYIIKEIPNSELSLLKKVLEWAILHYEEGDLTPLIHTIFSKIPDHHKLDFLKEILPVIMLWKYDHTPNNFFDKLKQYNIHQLKTSVEGDSLLILLIKHTYHFLNKEKYERYRKTLCHLFSFRKLNVNHQNAEGKTALHYAVAHTQRNHKTDLITLLLEQGADFSLLEASQQDFMLTQKRTCLFSWVLHQDNSYLRPQAACWNIQDTYLVEKLLTTESALGNHTKEELENRAALLEKTQTADWSAYQKEIKKTLLSSYDSFKCSEDSKSVCDLIAEYATPSFDSEKTSGGLKLKRDLT